jgi:hypothetical protein
MRDPTVSFSLSMPGPLVRAPSPPGAMHHATLCLAATVSCPCHKGVIPTSSHVRCPRPMSPLSEATPPPRCLSMPSRLATRTCSAPPPVRPPRRRPSPHRQPLHSLLSAATLTSFLPPCMPSPSRSQLERELKPLSSSEPVSHRPPSSMQGAAASHHTPSFPPPLTLLLPHAQVTEPWPEPSNTALLPFTIDRL